MMFSRRNGQTMRRLDGPKSTLLSTRLAFLAFVVTFVVATVISLRWTLANPGIAGWDQIQYIDLALRDELTRKLDGAGALRDALFNDYRWMPPGTRFLDMPLAFLHLETETDFRLFSLMLFGLSLLILFDAARRLSNTAVAAGTTAIIAVTPVWVCASENFMSETALIPAIAVALWCLVRETESMRPRATPILMGAALGFGMLARFSFAPMCAIIMIMLVIDAVRTKVWSRLLVTIVVATLIAWPSYAYNGVRYIAYGRFAATWPLDQLPGRYFTYTANYITVLAIAVVGLPLLLLLPFAIARVVMSLRRPDLQQRGEPGIQAATLTARRFIAIGCGIMVGSMLLPHVFGHNQNPRYMLGAMPPLALFLATGSGLRLALVLGGTATAQALILLGYMLTGPYTLPEHDAVDRTSLFAASWRNNPTCDFSAAVHAVSARVPQPVVKFYGVTGMVNHVQIDLAFLRAGVLAHVIPADLAAADLTDPNHVGADMILVLNVPHRQWTRHFVADPNTRVDAVREQLMHSPEFIHSDVRIGGLPLQCTMDVFLARKPSLLQAPGPSR